MTDARQTAEPTARKSIEIDPWTDWLGGLVERYPRLWTRLGDWETRLLGNRLDDIVIDRPIYIAGLARSGSTILLELLARHPDTATHRYRDFPLVLTPWAWSWFVDRAGQRQGTPQERAHRDRIKITRESPEAFEEVVWMHFFDGLHDASRNGVLNAKTHNPRFEAFYRDHMRKLLALREGRRCLSKGNYNVTRLGYIHKLFPDARFVVPIRDPLWHVASLIKQHRLFCSAEAADPRVLRHMQRSGHFEFGLDRRPVNVGDGAAAEVRRLWDAGEEAEGWATLWAAVYRHVADMLEDPDLAAATLVVRYEDLCRDPAATVGAILAHCELPDAGTIETAQSTISAPDYYAPSFDESEREAIRRRTEPVATRFSYG